jgi:hypothetical protein
MALQDLVHPIVACVARKKHILLEVRFELVDPYLL